MKPVSLHNSPLIAPTVDVIDPVCGMNVDLKTTPYRADYAGKTYGFCSATCQSKFTAEPPRYLADVAEPGDDDTKTKTATDPVCGMTVDPATTRYRYQYQGRNYYFCADSCQTKFAADPKRYLGGKAAPAQATSDGTIYTCPMHPEIRQGGRQLPDLRHGSRTGDGSRRHRAQRRT